MLSSSPPPPRPGRCCRGALLGLLLEGEEEGDACGRGWLPGRLLLRVLGTGRGSGWGRAGRAGAAAAVGSRAEEAFPSLRWALSTRPPSSLLPRLEHSRCSSTPQHECE